jgi:hypothetical protein
LEGHGGNQLIGLTVKAEILIFVPINVVGLYRETGFTLSETLLVIKAAVYCMRGLIQTMNISICLAEPGGLRNE